MRSIKEPQIDETRFERLTLLLTDAQVDFVVIGGLAVILQGGDHYTRDADYAFARKRENAKRIAEALAGLHPRPVDWPAGVPFVWDEQTIMNSSVLTLECDLGRIDLLAEAAGSKSYSDLKSKASLMEVDGRTVFVASIEDLLAMKRAAGRDKDKPHIAELETLLRLKNEQEG